MATTFDALRSSYRLLWIGMKINADKVAAADAAAKRIMAGIDRYKTVEARTGVPWFFIGLCHLREGNLSFETYLGNGQSIHKATTIVPAGRGPFTNFEAGAVDALAKQGLSAIKEWSLERIGYALEGFNGYGYRGKGINSPYLWAGTSRYVKGKYVADHVYDANAVDKQLGSMAVLSRLCVLNPEVNARVNSVSTAPWLAPDVVPVSTPVAVPVKPAGNIAGAAASIVVLGSGTVIANESSKKGMSIGAIAIIVGLTLVIAVAVFFVIRSFRKV